MIDVDYNEYKETLSENMKLIVENHRLEEVEKEHQKLNGELREEVERLKKREQECIDHYLVQCKYASEMEDKYIIANNIINKLEKYLIEEIEDYDKNINSQYITDIAREQYEGEKVCFEDMLGKLQELKGVDRE